MRKADRQLKEYIERFAEVMAKNRPMGNPGYHYKSLYHFAREEFKYYKPARLTPSEKGVVKRAIRLLGFKPQARQCFYNSQMLALGDPTGKIRYAEGYAINLIPTLHGWCEINGKLIDVTWRGEDGECVLGDFDKTRAYAGVVFPTEYFASAMGKSGWCKTLIEDYENGFPIMKNKWDGGNAVINLMK